MTDLTGIFFIRYGDTCPPIFHSHTFKTKDTEKDETTLSLMDTALHVVCQHLAVLVGYRAPQLFDVPLHSADLQIVQLV